MVNERSYSTVLFILGLIISYYLGYLQGLGILTEEQVKATIVFAAVLVMIATEYRHRTVAVLSGVVALWLLGIVSAEEMVEAIDFEVIGVLFGAMIIVLSMEKAGFFDIIGDFIARLPIKSPFAMIVIFSVTTAILSAFLDNVTTSLFMVPIALAIAKTRGIRPLPLLYSLAISANIGGMATLVGDPPNIMIASAVGFSFNDFLIHAAPMSIISLTISLVLIYFLFRGEIKEKMLVKRIKRAEEVAKEERPQRDTYLLVVSTMFFLVLLVLFVLQDFIKIKPGESAVITASIVLLLGGSKVVKVLQSIEWDVLLFLGGLLALVGGIEHTGLLSLLAQYIVEITGPNAFNIVSLVLWLSASLSAIIDNIPVAAVLIPVIKEIYPIIGTDAVWWSLVAATALGGIVTPISSVPNIIVYTSLRREGYQITFAQFVRYGMLFFTVNLITINVYLIVRYGLFGL